MEPFQAIFMMHFYPQTPRTVNKSFARYETLCLNDAAIALLLTV
jgi:hypothetical protein